MQMLASRLLRLRLRRDYASLSWRLRSALQVDAFDLGVRILRLRLFSALCGEQSSLQDDNCFLWLLQLFYYFAR